MHNRFAYFILYVQSTMPLADILHRLAGVLFLTLFLISWLLIGADDE